MGNNSRLFFTIGAARSGKDFYLKKWLREREGNEIRIPVHADSIRLSMGHRYNDYVEGLVHAIKNLTIRSYLEMDDVWVVVNGTHTNECSIKEILSIRNDAIPIVLNTPIEKCLQRAHNTNQEDLVPVIKRMFDNLRSIWDKYAREKHGWCSYYEDLGEFCLEQDKWLQIVDRIRENVTPPNYRIV